MDQRPQEIGIENARKTLGPIADRAHNQGQITYLTRNNQRIAAIIPVGSRATALPAAILDAAMDAAWPGLPAGMTMGEARRRTTAAINAAYPHVADLLDRAERDGEKTAAETQLAAVCARIREHGEQTGDMETALTYERLVLESWPIGEALTEIAEAASKAADGAREPVDG